MSYIFCGHPGLTGLHISGRSCDVPSILATHRHLEADDEDSTIDYAIGINFWMLAQTGNFGPLRVARYEGDTNESHCVLLVICIVEVNGVFGLELRGVANWRIHEFAKTLSEE